MGDEIAIAAATPEPLTDEQRQAFLDHIEANPTASVRAACEAVGIKRKQVRALKRMDAEFADDYREARGYGDERIRAAIVERAIDGVLEPVFGSLGGELGSGEIGQRRVFSDRLLALMAKAHLPEYRDVTRHEHTGPDGGPLEVTNPDVAAALDRFTSNIARLAERAADAAEPGGTVRPAEPERAALPPGGASD